MPLIVVHGAPLQCTMGTAPAGLQVPPRDGVAGGNLRAGTVMDFFPIANVGPFVMCQSPSNPQVAAATAAAAGVLTPQPCVPVVVAPWTNAAPTVKVGHMEVLQEGAQCACVWGGTIAPTAAGQSSVSVG